MPLHLDAMLTKRWFILAPTSSSSVKSASRDLRSLASSLGSAVLAVTLTSLELDSSRNAVMSSSEGEILNSSSLHLMVVVVGVGARKVVGAMAPFLLRLSVLALPQSFVMKRPLCPYLC